MSSELVQGVPEPEESIYVSSVDVLKKDIDAFLEVRQYLSDRISEVLVPGLDFYEVSIGGKTKKSLGKPGAEKIAAIMQFTVPEMSIDKETMEVLQIPNRPYVAYVCKVLNRHGTVLCLGRGARLLSADQGDVNKSVKMAQKSCYIDGIIRASGMSDVFTQDLEDMGGPPDPKPAQVRRNAESEETTAAIREALQNPLLVKLDVDRFRAVLKHNRGEENWKGILQEINQLIQKREEEK